MAENRMPKTVGLCPNGDHTGEFYMPNPKPGDVCPVCPEPLTIYRYVLDREAEQLTPEEAQAVLNASFGEDHDTEAYDRAEAKLRRLAGGGPPGQPPG